MKKEYKLKEKVWIHLGERTLTEGRVVEIIDLVHLKEGHSPDRELYIIELKTGIDDVYEVRDFSQISPDAKGPINLFRNLGEPAIVANSRYLKKVGMKLPVPERNVLAEIIKEINDDLADPTDPSPDQINAAIERAEKEHTTIFKPAAKRPARKNFAKRKTPNSGT